ncbi:MAG TPA: peptide ABC transporter substrate-binding protein [Verrucomicrobiae bacterium]|nr:peptide ABC transporter substrate-binding protein [Verrucomicrobiae bacterium]HXI95766.1 peptide ABC transporter substrate-binding protein [Candidatus Acidoferrum sp.]
MQKRLLGLLGSAMIVLAACGGAATPSPSAPSGSEPAASAPSGSESPAASGPTAGAPDLFGTKYKDKRQPGTTGGQVIFADWQEATEFNQYYQAQVTEANLTAATQGGLVTVTDDFKYAPDQASEIPTLDNGGVKVPGDNGDAMTVTWKLRPGLKWSDGQPLTCDDYKFTQDWIMDKDNTGLYAGKSGYEDVKKFECTDPQTIVLHFGKIYEGYIAMYPVPLPKHYMSKFTVKEDVQHKGMGAKDMPNVPVSGPFKYVSVTSGSEIRLARNDNYTNPWDGKPANLDTLIFKWYGDADAMIAGYKNGDFDIANDLNDADLPKIADQGDQVKQLDSLTYEFLRPNWNPDVCSTNTSVADRGKGCPVSDPAIREAIRWAVNKDEINTRLLGGAAALGFTNVSPNAWFYSPPPTYTFDPDKAKAVLDAAGWVPGADGIRAKNGLKAKIELCTTTRQVRQDTEALVSSYLKAVGIDSTVNAVAPADIFASYNEATDQTPCALSKYHYDVAEHAFSVPLDPLANYSTYHSSQFEPNGGNDGAIKDPDVDRILDGVKGTVDFAKIKDLMAEWQKVYVEKTIEIPLYFRKEVYLVNPKVTNFTGNPTSQGPTWNTYDWSITP